MTSSVRVLFTSVMLLVAPSFHAASRLQQIADRMSDSDLTSSYIDNDDEDDSIDVGRRSFERFDGQSSLGGLQTKREFDRIGALSQLGGVQKRPFDRIGSGSSLGGLMHKRLRLAEKTGYDNDDDVVQIVDRRSFDRIGSLSSLGGLQQQQHNKRSFDRIGDASALGGLQKKRSFDRIGGVSSLGGLAKRPFDRIGGMSSLGGLVGSTGGLQKKDGPE